jgi:hypothetical protein
MKALTQLARLVVHVAEARGIDALVAATHPRHARFYVRSPGLRKFGEVQSCPYAEGYPAVPPVQEFATVRESEVGQRLFGNPFTPEHLVRTHWDPAKTQFLRRLVYTGGKVSAQADAEQTR